MNGSKKLWQRVAIATAAVLVLFFVIAGALVIPVALNARSLIHDIKSGAPLAKAQKDAAGTNAALSRFFAVTNLPIIKQLITADGLNFSQIEPELHGMINASSFLLGGQRPQTYLIAFQNPAEARGTGGILGAYAIIQVHHGQISVLRTGSNAALQSLQQIPIVMPAEYQKLYGSDPAIWQNSNLSPHLPYGAKIWMALWEKQYNQHLDGVIVVDPIFLSHILNATEPITLSSGEKITAQNVVSKVLSEAYQKYASNNDARKQYLVDILNAGLAKIKTGNYQKIHLLQGIESSILENRLLIYSNDSKAEKTLTDTRLSGVMQTTPNNEYRAVVENIDASKLDYYLARTVSIKSVNCGLKRQSKITVVLSNTVTNPQDLPAYVLTRADKNKPKNTVTGAHHFKLFIYGPTNSSLIDASNSATVGSAGGVTAERNRPLLVTDIDLKPGESEAVIATFKGGSGRITFHDQPLVIPTALSISDHCRM